MKTETKTGTKEWADKNLNLFTGDCKNGCIYCYAISDNTRWNKSREFKIKPGFMAQTFKFRSYLTMYPSTHDIRPENINEHLLFLKNFLRSGSPILIVTKPHYQCIQLLCEQLQQYKAQVEFRFTIGSSSSEALKFYEPDAPDFSERVKSLTTAFFAGFKTSISIEPMLDTFPDEIVARTQDYVTGDIWIGKMNHPKSRLKMNGHLDKIPRVTQLTSWQADDDNILGIVTRLQGNKKVKWKDSIQKVINKYMESL